MPRRGGGGKCKNTGIVKISLRSETLAKPQSFVFLFPLSGISVRMSATWRRSRNVVDHSVWMVLFSFFEIASRRLSRVHNGDLLIIEDAKICASV